MRKIGIRIGIVIIFDAIFPTPCSLLPAPCSLCYIVNPQKGNPLRIIN
ncbi:MAG: hypothetical protein F6K65_38620 [Moorea sp. SIO3C2]|nr:hypothetical protein [Moorena sp. SIO3C2]